MVFLENPPDYSRLVEEFAWEKTYEEESKRRRQEEPVVAFASNLSKSLRRKFRKRERIEKVAFEILDRIVQMPRRRPAQPLEGGSSSLPLPSEPSHTDPD